MLENKISTLRNVLLDAQDRQITNLAVKDWLRRLKLVFYDADDLLDEVATKALTRQVETHKSMIRREVSHLFTSSNPIVFRFDVARKIKDIKERLDEIASEMRDFNFVVQVVEKPIQIKRREETSSFVRIPEVIGRGGDKEDLIKLLLSSDEGENVHIIPIVGMGGLGKTTLAQLVYNDYRIKNHFTKRLWVCVSDDFDIEKILRKLLTAAGDNNCNNAGIEQLQSLVQKMLSEERIFLVLDDVWNEDPVEWQKLHDLLMSEERGSRIVVTTRSRKVASIVRTMGSYQLKGLLDSDCLAILVKWAFEKGEESKHPNLINIGRETVKKCGGVPLAARTLGVLLYTKTNEHDWLSVRDNAMWAHVQNKNDILPVLRLSYDQMSSNLKQCFAYCSLFGKNQTIHRIELIYLWMAQGFLQSSERNEELEDIGKEYMEELVRRSFLQPDQWEGTYKMHDLVHDLAKYVAGCECMTLEGENTKVIPNTVQHVSFGSTSYHKLPRPLIEAQLRTIVVPRKIEPDFAVSIEAEFSSFSRLRVLNCKCTDAKLDDDTEQPFYSTEPVHLKPIGNLKHLRYLSFRGSKVHPKSLCKLLNLQYLDLYGSGLHELPEDFGKLINLRFLSLSSRLTCLPEKGIGGLTSLRTLQLYDNPELTSLSEGIRHLTCLRQLFIRKCPKLASLPIGFKHLTSLEYLSIRWCDTLKFSEDNDLLGMTSIKELVLTDLPELVCLPLGLQHVACSLNSLIVGNCPKLASLPTTGFRHLTSLENLSIKKCDTLKFSDDDLQGMRSLKKLVLSDLRELVSLPMGLQDAATSLHSLILRNCDKLKTLSESVLPNLKSLQVIEIEKCYSLFFLPQEMQSLTMLHSLKISECKDLIRRCFERDFFMIAHVPEIYIDGRKFKPSQYNIAKQLILQGQSWSKVLNAKEEHDFLGFSNVDTKFWT
ncbi:hypothetical protein ACSBR2_020170 [Camellia fascicularis]